MKAVRDNQLVIELSEIMRTAEDLLWKNILDTGRVGLIIIELSTRRRVRINGSAVLRDDMIEITIEQAYPNCPKYIQRRQIGFLPESGGTKLISSGISLLPEHWSWITHADTLFVASMDQQQHMDASHRGGRPGFVTKLDDHTLQVPDYPGNNMFNTLGNFVAYPKVGLIFIDFLQAKTLQPTGEVEIVWDAPGTDQLTGGTNRLWNFSIHSFIELKTNKNFSWSFMEYSPFNP
jgi:predicted pyridoxine 5'-phosphate oxidase superfamily flavin-nucleotide-binding protein